jgi:hypothetical protein
VCILLVRREETLETNIPIYLIAIHGAELEKQRNDILSHHFQMRRGLSMGTHTNGAGKMLFKEPGNIIIHTIV